MAGSPLPPLRVAVLISGRGSNLQALVETIDTQALPVTICQVVSNRADAAGLDWARARGLPAFALRHDGFATRDAFDAALLERLDRLAPDYILLAGFMRVLGPVFVRHFEGRLINIHPSLLPAFPGLRTHAQALAAGVQWHGCTVHFVTSLLDQGPIIAQGALPVFEGDTPAQLAQRLLPLEHQVYSQVLCWLADRRVRLLPDGRVLVRGVKTRAWVGSGAVGADGPADGGSGIPPVPSA